MGKKIIDIKTQRDASRGRKSKAKGENNQKRLNDIHPWLLLENDIEADVQQTRMTRRLKD